MTASGRDEWWRVTVLVHGVLDAVRTAPYTLGERVHALGGDVLASLDATRSDYRRSVAGSGSSAAPSKTSSAARWPTSFAGRRSATFAVLAQRSLCTLPVDPRLQA